MGCNRGFVTEGSISGVCLLVRDEERKELLNLDNEGVFRNPIFGDGTLLYRSIDCLKHNDERISIQVDAVETRSTDFPISCILKLDNNISYRSNFHHLLLES